MEIQKRILALDVGTKRIGVAVSDVFWMGATPVKVVLRKDDNASRDEIEKILNEYNTDLLLVGVPYNMDGTLGFQAKNCLDFVKPFRDKYTVLEQDERLSSSAAEDILRSNGKKYTKNKELVDITAACVILQEYLNSHRSK